MIAAMAVAFSATVMAQEKPSTFAEFSVMFGVGEIKAKRYWRPFTDTICRYLGR